MSAAASPKWCQECAQIHPASQYLTLVEEYDSSRRRRRRFVVLLLAALGGLGAVVVALAARG